MKKLFYVLIAYLLMGGTISKAQPAGSLPSSQLILSEKNYQVPFVWHGDSLNSRWNPYAALLIPVKLPACPKQFYMQFDLGAPNSLFYREKLKDIQTKYPRAVSVSGSTDKLINYPFQINHRAITAKEITVQSYSSPKIDWKDKESIEIIGTLGADLIENRVLVIDYPRKQIFIGEDIPDGLPANLAFSDFIFAQRRVLLPAIVDGKSTILYFDTGSSAFELLTDEETWKRLSDKRAVVSHYPVNSWGKMLTAHTVPTNASIEIAQTIIPIRNATYIEGVSESNIAQMAKLGIGGMTGNTLFLAYVLILDTKHKKFALTQQSVD